MKVIFKSNGEVKDVPDGYARNYLIPKGLVILATETELKKIEEHKKNESEDEKKKREELLLSAKKIDGKLLSISEKSGEGGRLFGSVTSKEIAKALISQQKLKIDKHNIELKTPIKLLGNYEIKVNFGMGVSAKFTLFVEESKE